MKTTITKPILFSDPMVRAILEGRKTQTRRPVKVTKPFIVNTNPGEANNQAKVKAHLKPAKYQPGDILYVRETWKVGAWRDEDAKVAFDYKASPELTNTPWVEYQDLDRFNDIHIKTIEELEAIDYPREMNDEEERFYYHWPAGKSPLKWKPSIFMPREAARIFLKVEDVRCERLNDITEEDAISEGVEKHADYGSTGYVHYGRPEEALTDIDAVWSFETLWQSIHGKDSWNQNPFVWVYDFKQVDKPTDFLI